MAERTGGLPSLSGAPIDTGQLEHLSLQHNLAHRLFARSLTWWTRGAASLLDSSTTSLTLLPGRLIHYITSQPTSEQELGARVLLQLMKRVHLRYSNIFKLVFSPLGKNEYTKSGNPLASTP